MKKLLTCLIFVCTTVCAQGTSYGVFSYTDVEYVHNKNIEDVRSIASITKLFTAKAVIDSDVSLSEPILVQGKSTGRFARGIKVERYELLRAMLMSSDNLAAESLAHAHPGGMKQFLLDVNADIGWMGLKNTEIADSTGLLAGNKSTVEDLNNFLFTLRKYPIIQRLSAEKHYTTEYKKGKKTIKVNLKNTNPQIWTYDSIILTKTGFTSAAGRCLAMLVEKGGELYSVISLGNRTVLERSRNISDLMNEIGER